MTAFLAGQLIDSGRWDEAAQTLAEHGDVDVLDSALTFRVWIERARLGVRRGEFEAIHRTLPPIRAAVARMPDGQQTSASFAVVIDLALAEGRLDDADREAEEGLERVLGTQDTRGQLLIALRALRVAADRAVRARARADAVAVDAAVAAGERHAATVRRIAAADASVTLPEQPSTLAVCAAEEARVHGDRRPDLWAAAAVACQSLGNPYGVAWCRYREAEAIVDGPGNRADATTALLEAASIADELGARPLRTDIGALAARARIDLRQGEPPVAAEAPEAASPLARYGLTSREREILPLVAQGWTNRRIAEALFISESTAGVHVSNLISKLGVSNRTEAAGVAVRAGINGEATPGRTA